MTQVAIVGATLIDGNGGPPTEDSMILVEDGRFLAVGSRNGSSPPAGATVVDASGQYVIPGLINSEVVPENWTGC